MLNEIAKHFLRDPGVKVIAVANTIHDKFTARGELFEALKASSGKGIVRKTLKQALRLLNQRVNQRFGDFSRTLEYVGFDPIIGLRVSGLDKHYEDIIYASRFDDKKKSELTYDLSRFKKDSYHPREIVPINIYPSSFFDQRDSALIGILQYEKELRAEKVIRGIDVFLSRDKQFIPATSGSSGELTLITSLLYLMITLTENSVVLIDEPENSLHPKWQTEYVKQVADLFYRYQPKVIIATHSPLIINSAELNVEKIKVFKGAHGEFVDAKVKSLNVEELYQDYFDVTTPENRFLSQQLVTKMNELAEKEIGLPEFEQAVRSYSENAFDEKQKAVLSEVLDMGKKITKSQQDETGR